MDGLPLELLEQIFTEACVDGGRTGCSLSLVSTQINAVARNVRFHTLFITPATPSRVSQLLVCLKKEYGIRQNLGHTPKIKHLCITVREEPNANAEQRQEQDAATINQAPFFTEITTLIQLASRDLQTFCFVHCAPSSESRDLGIELRDVECGPGGFPALRELTIVGSYPFAEALPGTAPVMPHLERLHLVIPAYGTRVKGMKLGPWPVRAPRLTHFRLTNVLYIPEGLEQVLGVDEAGAGSSTRFLSLKVALVQPIGQPGRTPGGRIKQYAGQRERGVTMKRLNGMMAAAPCLQLILPGTMMRYNRRWDKDVVDEWMGRFQGGEGCWRV